MKLSEKIDSHTLAAAKVAEHDYFKINEFSSNENPGLLIGTIVKKESDPVGRDSIYWRGEQYWTVNVRCPNGELRKVCCDVLVPLDIATGLKKFVAQQNVFEL